MWIWMLSAAWAQGPIRVTTFNVWGLPWPLTPGRAQRMRAIDHWLHDGKQDFVALQEAWRGARRHLPDDLHYPLTDRDSGLALYSPHPVERLGFVPFEAQRGPDRWKSKGVWWVQVQLPEAVWTVGVVHLQAGTGRRNGAVRAAQIETVLASAPPGPLFLMGDFNLHRGRPLDVASHERLVEAGLVEARPRLDHGTSRYGAHRLDRVYVSEDVEWTVGRARVRRSVTHSDHFPVTVELGQPE